MTVIPFQFMKGCYRPLRIVSLSKIKPRSSGKHWSPDFPLIRYKPHRKQSAQQFFYCCLCIHCPGNVFTEPLPNNDRGIQIQTHRLMGGIYEVYGSDGLRRRGIHTLLNPVLSCLTVSRFCFFILVILQTVGLFGRVISSSQGLYLNTRQHKHRKNTYT
jgi:hypothetical protein